MTPLKAQVFTDGSQNLGYTLLNSTAVVSTLQKQPLIHTQFRFMSNFEEKKNSVPLKCPPRSDLQYASTELYACKFSDYMY